MSVVSIQLRGVERRDGRREWIWLNLRIGFFPEAQLTLTLLRFVVRKMTIRRQVLHNLWRNMAIFNAGEPE